MNSKYSPPASDELEVSIFGPGFGESILVHVGQARWLIIDSCTDSYTKRPAALQYLESLGLSAENCVDFVVASHWHADHVAGLSELYQAATKAALCCSRALTRHEFLALAELYQAPNKRIPFGPEELKACLELAAERSETLGKSHILYATPNRVLWEKADLNVILTSLSPSDEMERRSTQSMADALAAAKSGSVEPRLRSKSPNDVAVALRLSVNGRSLLFGSDLEEEGNPLVGWSAVIAAHQPHHPISNVFKVAHHGSSTGQHEAIWLQLLAENPLALLTPFRHGKHRIPNEQERNVVLANSNYAYISADPNQLSKPKKKTTKVQTFIDRTAKNRRLADPATGHIRWRAPIADPSHRGQIELFDSAMELRAVSGP